MNRRAPLARSACADSEPAKAGFAKGARQFIGRVLALLLILGPVAAAQEAPKVILYYSNAPSVRDAFREERPNLQALLRESGVSLLVTGPARCDPYVSLRTGRYVPVEEAGSAEPAGFPDGVMLLIEPRRDSALGDRLLGETRRRYPGVPVLAVHPGPWIPEGVHLVRGISIPSWVAFTGQHGRLFSETARRAGVVSILDVLPTLQRHSSGSYDRSLPGRPMWGDGLTYTPVRRGLPYHLEEVVRLQDTLRTMARVTPPALTALGFAVAALLVLAGFLLWPRHGKGRGHPGLRRFAQGGLTVCFLAAAGMIPAAGRHPDNPAAFALYSVAVTGAFFAFSVVAGRLLADSREDATAATLQMASGAVAGIIAVSAMRHSMGLLLAPFSSLYLFGVRFYGIGNETAALFIVAVVLFGLMTVQRAQADRVGPGGLLALGAWFVAASLVLGRPDWGANAGAMLACLAAGGIAWTLVARRSGVRHAWAYPVLAAAAMAAVVVWLDASSPHATHVGRFVRGLEDGSGGVTELLRAKASIFRAVFTSPWLYVALAFWALAYALMRGPLASVPLRLRRRWPWAALALPALLLGGLFGALVNDSGLIVFGLMFGPGAVLLCVLALEPAGLALIESPGHVAGAGAPRTREP